VLVEHLLSYDDIYQNCAKEISKYAEKNFNLSQEQKITFIANSVLKEKYTLHFSGQNFSFRAEGHLANDDQYNLIQGVIDLAEKCKLINTDDARGESGSKKKNKRKLKNISGSPTYLTQGSPNKKLRCISQPTPSEKRRKNLRKAFLEHDKEEDVSLIFKNRIFAPLSFTYSLAQARGDRDHMEDVGFCIEKKGNVLAGVFDGHCDSGLVADYASKYFQNNFLKKLKKTPDQITKVFVDLIKNIHANVKILKGGSTAAVCYIDKSTNYVYTATLGDSESIVFRKRGNSIKWFPVSCVRDWSSAKDASRAVEGLKLFTKKYVGAKLIDYPKFLDLENWTQEKHPKRLRFPPHPLGLNVSRTIGDHNNIDAWPPVEILSQKPKVTEFPLGAQDSEDCVVIGSDGIWDFVEIQQLINDVLLPHWGAENMAQLIVDYVLKTPQPPKRLRDNVTAVCIYAKKQI
jgi:serine/threonine protein phosphatase PrpC